MPSVTGLPCTLVSHFYNEEYLLPWWLTHHLPLFDHGILINRGSTDRSVEICRALAPHWEVRDSKVPEFDAVDVDKEVMEIELERPGWKMTLNTSEFLCLRQPSAFFASIDRMGRGMYAIPIVMMVDDPAYAYLDPVYTRPLVAQRHHGFLYQQEHAGPYVTGRFIHKRHHGAYGPGRHTTSQAFGVYPSGALVLKFLYSPWNRQMIARKTGFAPTLSVRSRAAGLGFHHLFSAAEHERRYLEFVKDTRNLWTVPEYQQVFGVPHDRDEGASRVSFYSTGNVKAPSS